MESKVEELGIIVDDSFGNQPHLKAKRCNKKLKIYREFGLATLSVLAKQISSDDDNDKSKQVKACDAISSGIMGLQWKKHLHKGVHVTLAETGDLTKLKSNAVANSLTPTEVQLDGKRSPGDPYPDQNSSEVHVYCADAKALLIMESFRFIFINPPRSCINFIDPAFQNVTNNGVICLVVPDISVFARSEHIVQRHYAADVIKTEYLKELATRVVLATMARAAARCNKGICPLYVVAKEDFLLITVQIKRGNGASDTSLKEITKLLHCRFCEERVFIERQLAPDENPYRKLPCNCKTKNTGKTAVIIGPMWKGPIFHSEFLKKLQMQSKDLPLSPHFHNVLDLLVTESLCSPLRKSRIPQNHPNPNNSAIVDSDLAIEKDAKDLNKNNHKSSHVQGELNEKDQTLPCSEDQLTLESEQACHRQGVDLQSQGKRKNIDISTGENNEEQFEVKRSRTDSSLFGAKKSCQDSVNVPFYYNIRKCKKPTLPKLDQYVNQLQSSGFHASRTHFDPCCIRTSATVEEFLAIL